MRQFALAIPIIVAMSAACSSSSSGPGNSNNNSCVQTTTAIDRFKELEIVDDSIISGPRSQNATDGVWSFRHVMEELAGPGADVSAFTLAWFSSFTSANSINLYPTSARPKVDAAVICPWLLTTPENNCNSDCSQCSAHRLDLAKAPYRLMAIANRMDLHLQKAGLGEGRLLFGVTHGPADAAQSAPDDMSIIVEFNLPSDGNRSEGYWAKRWHALGSHTAFDESFATDLASVVAEFAHRENLAQVRTNERVFDWNWQLREFHLNGGQLVLAGTENTPDKSLNGTSQLTQFVNGHLQDIRNSQHDLPTSMEGGEAAGGVSWVVNGVSEDVRKAFAKETCNGCHQVEESSVDINFHISPLKKGTARVSTFLNNPAAPQSDELARRSKELQLSLCQ